MSAGFPDFGNIQPRDGAIAIARDYVYHRTVFNVMTEGAVSLQFIRLQCPDPQNPGEYLPLGLPKGAALRIPVIGGGFSVRKVRCVVGSIVELQEALVTEAIPGHQVKRIKAYSQAYIDARLQDLIAKGKLKAAANGRYLAV